MNRATSAYLDAVRLTAACVVVIVHASYDRLAGKLPALWRVADLGNDAVMAFFVLSGFVIAFVADTKEKTAEAYAVSRAARLYSVAIPALVLTLVCDTIGSHLSPTLYQGWWFEADRPVWRTLASLLFVNELWFSSIRPFSNGPFWSLGYEAWYYVIFASFHYSSGRARYVGTALAAGIAGPKILLLLPVWLFGLLAYHSAKHGSTHKWRSLALALAAAAAYWAFRTVGGREALTLWTQRSLGPQLFADLGWSKGFLAFNVMGALIALHFVGAARYLSDITVSSGLAKTVAYMASFTFGLYLFHYPLLQFFAAVADVLAINHRPAFLLATTVTTVCMVCTVTERRKSDLRKAIQRALDKIRTLPRQQVKTP